MDETKNTNQPGNTEEPESAGQSQENVEAQENAAEKEEPKAKIQEPQAEEVEVRRVESAESSGPIKFDDGKGTEIVLVDASKFDREEIQQADEQAEKLDFLDTNAIMLFGSEPQKELNNFLDGLMSDIKVKEAGPMGDLTIALAKGIEVTRINEFQNQIQNGRSILAKIPLIGRWFDYARIFLAKQGDFQKLVDNIKRKAELRKEKLMRRNIQLDGLYQKNDETQDKMALCIVAAEKASAIGQQKLAELIDKAEKTRDPQDAEVVRNFTEQLTTFKVRVSDMKTAYMRSMVSGPQIKTVQQAGKIEMQNVTRSLLNDLPALKQAIVMAAANYNILQAQAERKGRQEALRKIEQANVAATGRAYIQAKQSQGDALDDARHIAEIANSVLATMREGVEIEKQNEAKRAEAERVLISTKSNLTEGLMLVKELQAGQAKQIT